MHVDREKINQGLKNDERNVAGYLRDRQQQGTTSSFRITHDEYYEGSESVCASVERRLSEARGLRNIVS